VARCAAETCRRWRPAFVARVAGTHIDGRWFCSRRCVEEMAHHLLERVRPLPATVPSIRPTRLGALLRRDRLIDAEGLERALAGQRESGRRLGEELQLLQLVESTAILRALAAQAAVPYLASVDPAAVLDGPGGLPREAVRAFGLIPLGEPDDESVKVACVAPVPYAAIAALRQLTGWRVAPYLVSDESWAALLDAYGTDRTRKGRTSAVHFVRAGSLAEAASRIAGAAVTARETTVTEAHWEPYTCIRVQGHGLVQDVLLTHDAQEDRGWLAASTLL